MTSLFSHQHKAAALLNGLPAHDLDRLVRRVRMRCHDEIPAMLQRLTVDDWRARLQMILECSPALTIAETRIMITKLREAVQ